RPEERRPPRDFAFSSRSRERPARCREQVGLPERRDTGSGRGVELLDGRRGDEPGSEGAHGRAVCEQPPGLRYARPQGAALRMEQGDRDGLLPIPTAGHSIGHTSFMLSSGMGQLFIQSDVTNHPDLFARHPDWAAFFDQDPTAAVNTRREVYEMLVSTRI